jgi:hypothetical protein
MPALADPGRLRRWSDWAFGDARSRRLLDHCPFDGGPKAKVTCEIAAARTLMIESA